MGYGRLGHIQHLRQIADTHFRAEQGIQDTDSRHITEYFKKRSQVTQFSLFRYFIQNPVFQRFMHMKAFTLFYRYVLFLQIIISFCYTFIYE